MNRKGFSEILILVILVVVGILVVGWYWYSRNANQVSNGTSQSTTVTMTSTSPVVTNPSTSTPGASSTTATTTLGEAQPTCTFAANPNQDIYPEKSELTWACQNVETCSITSSQGDSFPNQSSTGTLSVTPSLSPSVNYVLSCAGVGAENISKTVSVAVAGTNTNPADCPTPGECE